MDPNVVHGLTEALAPFLVVLALGAIPASLVFLSKHFRLKTRELELEAELHGREAQARIQALETRQAALEGTLHALVQALRSRVEEPRAIAPAAAAHTSAPQEAPPHEPLEAGSAPARIALAPKR